MRTRTASLCLFLTWFGASTYARSSAAEEAAKPRASAPQRKDPRGVTGVSPFWERLGKGDAASLARDFDAALAAYREAAAANPENALAHYRIGQAQARKGDLKEAELAYTTALRFAAQDAELKAKVLFCLADLRERQRSTDEAIQRWADYEAHQKAHETLKAFPATAAERTSRNQAWKKLSADSAAVKARIETRLREAEAAVKKSSK